VPSRCLAFQTLERLSLLRKIGQTFWSMLLLLTAGPMASTGKGRSHLPIKRQEWQEVLMGTGAGRGKALLAGRAQIQVCNRLNTHCS